MNADLLREAASKMRERAEAATPGPWRVGAEGSEGSRVNPATGDKREDSHWIASVNGRVQPEDGRNAEHIASWHPDVALAVALLLDAEAALIDGATKYPDLHSPLNGARVDLLLAVARAYLGEVS